MTGVALCNGVFITDQCKDTSSQCKQTNLYAGLAKEVNLSTYQPLNLSTCHSLTLSLSQPLNISTYQPLSMSTTSHPLNLSTCHSLNLSTSQPPYKKVILIKLNLPGRQPKFANVKLRAGHYFQLRVFLEPGERNSTRKLFWPLQFGLQRNQEVS